VPVEWPESAEPDVISPRVVLWAGLVFPSWKFVLAERKRWGDGWWLVGNLGFLAEDWPTHHISVPKDFDFR